MRDQPPRISRYVRVNTLKNTPDEVIKTFREENKTLLPACDNYKQFIKVVSNLKKNEFIRDYHMKDVLVFPPGSEFHRHQLYQDGSILLQDKASCLASYLLSPPPGAVVLDACAAPGMKTTHLSALTRNKGRIFAVEQCEERYKTLCTLVTSANCKNVECINTDFLKITQETNEWCNEIEYILVDPSCSGSGMKSRTNIYPKEKLDRARLKRLSTFQRKILHHALTQFPNVKRVVYSTCSVYEEENEAVVEQTLNMVQNKYSLVNTLPEWPRRGSKNYECGPNCYVARPDSDHTNGFFIAVFERREDYQEQSDSEEINHVNKTNHNLSKKIKKKKKSLEKNELKKETDVEIHAIEEITPHKKKKKKKDLDSDLCENSVNGSEYTPCKKKKKDIESDLCENSVNNSEYTPCKKKKKKKKDLEPDFCKNSVNGSENKLCKKKKKKDLESDLCETEYTLSKKDRSELILKEQTDIEHNDVGNIKKKKHKDNVELKHKRENLIESNKKKKKKS